MQSLLDEWRGIPQVDIRHKKDLARLALNLSLTTQVEKRVRWSRHKYYTMGDKPTTLLARKLVHQVYSSALPKLRVHNRFPSQNPKLILQEFHNFTSTLYCKPDQFSEDRADDVFLINKCGF